MILVLKNNHYKGILVSLCIILFEKWIILPFLVVFSAAEELL